MIINLSIKYSNGEVKDLVLNKSWDLKIEYLKDIDSFCFNNIFFSSPQPTHTIEYLLTKRWYEGQYIDYFLQDAVATLFFLERKTPKELVFFQKVLNAMYFAYIIDYNYNLYKEEGEKKGEVPDGAYSFIKRYSDSHWATQYDIKRAIERINKEEEPDQDLIRILSEKHDLHKYINLILDSYLEEDMLEDPIVVFPLHNDDENEKEEYDRFKKSLSEIKLRRFRLKEQLRKELVI